MSHYEVDFTPYTKGRKRVEVLHELRNWWGHKFWEMFKICAELADNPSCTFQQFEISLGVSGVSGFPVFELWEILGREIPEEFGE